ncbi:hypothetical protein B0H17DRAFT_1146612 [Mycena rosella]|uniref:Uncharacterized protein n=1 Tax=Mycena rosella TaxID=1033263 RepID=A0AAD7CNI3_MYCRO|nr:hypothetical protein B0H17DRAFT_1146612 [Mycena rosella]
MLVRFRTHLVRSSFDSRLGHGLGSATLDLSPAAQNKVKTPEFIEEEIESTNLQGLMRVPFDSGQAMLVQQRLFSVPLPAAQNEERRVDVRLHAMPVFWISLFNTPKATDTCGRLALHPSALSDADHALFTASLADLADITGDLEHVSVSVREARAWLCGDPAPVCPRDDAQQRRLLRMLRLVLHAQAGRGVDRSLAFVQAPVPAAPILAPTKPFLPTPAPSPEARACPPLPPRKLTSPTSRKNRRHVRVLDVERLVRPAKDTTRTPPPSPSPAPRRTRSLPADVPLHRASTQRVPASSPPHIQHFADSTMQRTVSAGRAPHTHLQNPAQPPAQAQVHPHVQNPAKTKTPPAPPRPGAPLRPVRAHLPELPARHSSRAGRTPAPRARTTSFAPHPPVRPQRRASAFEATYGAPASPSHTTHAANDGRRISSDSAPARRPSSSSYASELTRSPARKRIPPRARSPPANPSQSPAPHLAGAGWAGAERGGRWVCGAEWAEEAEDVDGVGRASVGAL